MSHNGLSPKQKATARSILSKPRIAVPSPWYQRAWWGVKGFFERWGWLILVVIATTAIVAVISGCAAALRDDGTLVVGVPFSGEGGSASAIGNTVGGILGNLGVPGAGLIGVGITGVLGALGYGVKKSGDAKAATARHEAADQAWDEAQAHYQTVYATPPPRPPAPSQPEGVSL